MTGENTILVVEDSDDIRATLRQFLLRSGYRVAEAVNGREAVEFARRRCPDLILMDINMPVMDGIAATEQIRRLKDKCESVPILALTAHDTYGMEEAALEAGCNDYILKPIDLTRLEKTIELMLTPDS